MQPYDHGILTKLKGSASSFFFKVKQVMESDIKSLISVKSLDEAKSEFTRVIERNDYRIIGDRILVADKAGITAYYSINEDESLTLYKVDNAKFNLQLKIDGEDFCYAAKGKSDKYIEVLNRVTDYGYVYSQPMTILPNVILNINGGFRNY